LVNVAGHAIHPAGHLGPFYVGDAGALAVFGKSTGAGGPSDLLLGYSDDEALTIPTSGGITLAMSDVCAVNDIAPVLGNFVAIHYGGPGAGTFDLVVTPLSQAVRGGAGVFLTTLAFLNAAVIGGGGNSVIYSALSVGGKACATVTTTGGSWALTVESWLTGAAWVPVGSGADAANGGGSVLCDLPRAPTRLTVFNTAGGNATMSASLVVAAS